MLTRLTNVIAARLADAPLVPLDLARFAPDLRTHIEALGLRAETLGFAVDLDELLRAVDAFETVAGPVQQRLEAAVADGRVDAAALAEINRAIMSDRRSWLREQGLPGRPWFRNLFAATDPDSGYAAWMLPEMRFFIEQRDTAGLEQARRRCVEAVESTQELLESIDAMLGN
jgi:N-acetylated-alpha-linked acidic dipeptidase